MLNFLISKFGGVNKRNPANELGTSEASDIKNVRIDEKSLWKRDGVTTVGSLSAGIVRKLMDVRNVLLAAQAGNILKYSGGSWVTAGLSGLNTSAFPRIISMRVSTTSYDTGTFETVDDTQQSFTDTGKSFAENALVGKVLKITNGSASGQIRTIAANTATVILASEPFYGATGTPTYEIFNTGEGNYFFNGVDQPKKDILNTLTTWSNIANIPFFKYVEKYKNRIVGVTANSYELKISGILNGEDYPYTIDAQDGDSDYITGLANIGDQLVIFKSMKILITDFTTNPAGAEMITRADTFGCIAPESIAVGENILFFVSHRGIEWFNTLETNALEAHKSLSDYRLPEIEALGQATLATAKGVTFDAKYFCAIGSTVYIFDIGYYLQSIEKENKGRDYCFLIDSFPFTIESIEVNNGELYIGGSGKVYKYNSSATTDDGTAIESYWTTKEVNNKMRNRPQIARKILLSTNAEDNISEFAYNTCESASGWTNSEDVAAISTDASDYKQGTKSINFDITTSGNLKTILRYDLANQNIASYSSGTLNFWINADQEIIENFTSATITLFTTGSANYKQYDFTDQFDYGWKKISVELGSPDTQGGSFSFSDFDYMEIEIQYPNTTANFSIKIDDIRFIQELETVTITVNTDVSSTQLTTTDLDKDIVTVQAKMTRGKKHLFKLDISDMDDSKIQQFEALFEVGKI